jgi:hypothetical protein
MLKIFIILSTDLNKIKGFSLLSTLHSLRFPNLPCIQLDLIRDHYLNLSHDHSH